MDLYSSRCVGRKGSSTCGSFAVLTEGVASCRASFVLVGSLATQIRSHPRQCSQLRAFVHPGPERDTGNSGRSISRRCRRTHPPSGTRSPPSGSRPDGSTSTPASPAPTAPDPVAARRWRPAAPETPSWSAGSTGWPRSVPDARDIVDELTSRGVRLNLGGSVHARPTPSAGSCSRCSA